jgi:hypothetical protein
MPQDIEPKDLAAGSPRRFELTEFLAGRTRAWGVFEDRFGRLRRRFDVDMHGRWEGETFVLDEQFTYDTGETEARTWRVKVASDGRFTATCPDCIGEARGTCTDDVIRMRYRFRLKLGAREIAVDFDDRLYRMGPTLAVNRARMSKWGVELGALSLFFTRETANEAAGQARAAAA